MNTKQKLLVAAIAAAIGAESPAYAALSDGSFTSTPQVSGSRSNLTLSSSLEYTGSSTVTRNYYVWANLPALGDTDFCLSSRGQWVEAVQSYSSTSGTIVDGKASCREATGVYSGKSPRNVSVVDGLDLSDPVFAGTRIYLGVDDRAHDTDYRPENFDLLYTVGDDTSPTPDPDPVPTDDFGGAIDSAYAVDSLPFSTEGSIETSGDVDYFRVSVTEAGSLTAHTTGTTDTVGTLFDASGSQVALNDDGGESWNFEIVQQVSPGDYYLEVAGFTSHTGGYTLDLAFSAASPELPSTGNSDNYNLTNALSGSWQFDYTIVSAFDDQYTFTGPPVENSTTPDRWNVFGVDTYGNADVIGGYAPSLGRYSVLDQGNTIDRYYVFDLSGTTLSGCYYQVYPAGSANLSRCYPLTGYQTSTRAVPGGIDRTGGGDELDGDRARLSEYQASSPDDDSAMQRSGPETWVILDQLDFLRNSANRRPDQGE